jgi:hypothetical protein
MGWQWWLSNIFGGVVRWVAVHVQMSPAVAGARLASFTVVILGVNEAPDFIHLDALAGQFIRPYVTMRGVADGLLDRKLMNKISRA